MDKTAEFATEVEVTTNQIVKIVTQFHCGVITRNEMEEMIRSILWEKMA